MNDASADRTSVTLLGKLRYHPGDQSAWRDFVLRYGPRIQQWCLQRNLQLADAQDVTQTVLLKILEKMGSFEYNPSLSFRAWLKTVTMNATTDYLAALMHRTGRADRTIGDLLENVAAQEDLARRMEEEFDLELLEQAMAHVRLRVAPQTWEAFHLTAIECLPGVDVAARLKMRLATVYTAKSQVQRLIREEIARLEV